MERNSQISIENWNNSIASAKPEVLTNGITPGTPLVVRFRGVPVSRIVSVTFGMRRVGTIEEGVAPIRIGFDCASVLSADPQAPRLIAATVVSFDAIGTEFTQVPIYLNAMISSEYYSAPTLTDIYIAFHPPIVTEGSYGLGDNIGYSLQFVEQVQPVTSENVYTGGFYQQDLDIDLDFDIVAIRSKFNGIYMPPPAGYPVYAPLASGESDESLPITGIMASGYMKKQSRLELYEATYPFDPADPASTSPPYNMTTGLPSLTYIMDLVDVANYASESKFSLTAGKFTLSFTPEKFARYADIVTVGKVIRLKEYYAKIGYSGTWLTRGTYIITGVTPSAAPGSRDVQIECSSALSKLSDTFAGRLHADKIYMGKRELTPVVTPADGKDFYIFVDGILGYHTYNFCEHPNPVFTRQKKPAAIDTKKYPIEIVCGTGEVIIDKEHYESSVEEGGLGREKVYLKYWRWAIPNDSIELTVESVDGTGITVDQDGAPPTSWTNCIMEVLTGGAAHKLYRVVEASAWGDGRTYIRCAAGQVPMNDHLTSGDKVRIVNANLPECLIRRVLLSAGFQDTDPTKPWYIKSIAAPYPTMPIPSTADFDATYEDNVTHQEMLERIQQYLPPHYKLLEDQYGNVEFRSVIQSASPDFTLTDTLSATYEPSNTERKTEVHYRVRNRDIQDAVRLNSPLLASTEVFNTNYLEIVPSSFMASSPVATRAVKAITDHNMDTVAKWTSHVYGKTPPNPVPEETFYDMDLIQFNFTQVIHPMEIHLRSGTEESILYVVGLDEEGYWREVGDECHFTEEDEVIILKSDQDWEKTLKVTALRIKCSFPSHVSNLSLSIDGIAVYPDDTIVGIARLGTDQRPGTTTDEFAADKEIYRKLGRIVYEVPEIDEFGFYIARTMGLSLEDYAKLRAMEWLGELSRDFSPIRIKAIRPDITVGKTALATIERFGLRNMLCLVQATNTKNDTSVSAELIPYGSAPVGANWPTIQPWTYTTIPPPSTSSTTSTVPHWTTASTWTNWWTLWPLPTSTTSTTRSTTTSSTTPWITTQPPVTPPNTTTPPFQPRTTPPPVTTSSTTTTTTTTTTTPPPCDDGEHC